MMLIMRRRYCSPVAECICVETFIIAASAAAARNVTNPGDEESEAGGSSWGNIWD